MKTIRNLGLAGLLAMGLGCEPVIESPDVAMKTNSYTVITAKPLEIYFDYPSGNLSATLEYEGKELITRFIGDGRMMRDSFLLLERRKNEGKSMKFYGQFNDEYKGKTFNVGSVYDSASGYQIGQNAWNPFVLEEK